MYVVKGNNEQRLTVVYVIPLTLLPRGNTQVGNYCTELGHTPLDKYISMCYNKGTVKERK